MKINGRTIAVLGGGLYKLYPKENEWLFHKILANCGCIITEYAPNVDASKENFPKRNRIVSGLSDAVLVIEAEYRSGTSITVKYAKQQEKIVCCLPSNVDSPCGIGTNRFIQEGARLITKPSEIISILEENQKTENSQTHFKHSLKESNKISPEYERILQTISKKPIHINELGRILNQDIKQITPILTMLELEEYIESLPGNQFKRKD